MKNRNDFFQVFLLISTKFLTFEPHFDYFLTKYFWCIINSSILNRLWIHFPNSFVLKTKRPHGQIDQKFKNIWEVLKKSAGKREFIPMHSGSLPIKISHSIGKWLECFPNDFENYHAHGSPVRKCLKSMDFAPWFLVKVFEVNGAFFLCFQSMCLQGPRNLHFSAQLFP